jgi:hypothetical protein
MCIHIFIIIVEISNYLTLYCKILLHLLPNINDPEKLLLGTLLLNQARYYDNRIVLVNCMKNVEFIYKKQ